MHHFYISYSTNTPPEGRIIKLAIYERLLSKQKLSTGKTTKEVRVLHMQIGMMSSEYCQLLHRPAPAGHIHLGKKRNNPTAQPEIRSATCQGKQKTENTTKNIKSKMSSDEDEAGDEEVQFFQVIEKVCKPNLQTALLGLNITTMDMVLSQHGMGEDNPKDAAIIAVLTKAKAIDGSIDLGLGGEDANSLRLLHRKCKKGEHSTPPSKKAKSSHEAAEEVEDTAATKAFARLKSTQNVDIKIEGQLQHRLVHSMIKMTEGTVNIYTTWTMDQLRRETDRRVGFRKIKDANLYEETRDNFDSNETGRRTGP